MWIKKGLIIGIIASLGAGVVAAAADLGLDAAGAGTMRFDDSPITVPIGRLGDQLAYATFERDNDDEPWQRVGTSEFRADRVETVVDASTFPHEALVVLSPPDDYVFGGPAGAGGLADLETDYHATFEMRDYVDLRSRDLIAGGMQTQLHYRDLFVREQWDNHSQLQPGPFSVGPLGPDVFRSVLPFPFQGRTYRLGENTEREATELLANDVGIQGGLADIVVHDLSFSGSVAKRAVVDGHDAYGIESAGCMRIELLPETWAWAHVPGHVEFLHTSVALPARVCYETTTWLSGDFSYPLLYEARVVANDTITHEWLETLGSFVAGHTVIPWHQTTGPATYRETNSEAERSPASQRHPADGADLRLAYPLSLAIADSGETPLVQYTQWQSQHADARMAGARLHPSSSGSLRWDLVYATPAGQAFVISTERAQGSLGAFVTEVGSFTTSPFSDEDPVYAPITLAAADELRRRNALEPARTQDANMVVWGLIYAQAGVRCNGVSQCSPSGGTVSAHGLGINSIIIGHGPPPTTATGVPLGYGSSNADSWIRAYTDSGNLFISSQLDSRRGLVSMPGADDSRPATIVAATSLPGVRPADVSRAALVSSSILLLFLVAYFLPFLKFVGTQAFTLIPGYAKIQKSDVLHNKIRDTRVSAIRTDPGITAPKLQTLTGAGWSTVVYHLGVLERNKLVSSILDGRHRRFFPVEALNWSDRTRVAMLKNARTRELYEAILGEPGVGFRELSHQVGISRPALYWHVDRLTKAGLVGQDKDGQKIRFYANEPGPGPAAYDANAASEVA